jgi:hypothetical protein
MAMAFLTATRPRPPPTTQRVDADEHNQGPPESAVAVFFGMFRAEDTLLAARPLGSPAETLITYPAVRETKEGAPGDRKPPSSISVAVFFGHIFSHSGRPNHVDEPGLFVPPLELKFFEYFLRRHLGVCFNWRTFTDDNGSEGGSDRSYHQFVGTATIFSHDDVEDRRALYDDSLECADFLDGSEVLTKFPPDWERIYLQRE